MDTRGLRRLFGVCLAFAVLLLACGAFGEAEKRMSSAPPEATLVDEAGRKFACENMEIDHTSASPGDVLTFSPWPPELSSEQAQLTMQVGQHDPIGLPLAPVEGGLAFIAPIHPNGMDGGSMELTLTAEATPCLIEELAIEPMSPAPGAFDEYVNTVAEYLEITRSIYGVTREDLLADDLSPLPLHLLPVAFGQYVLDGPDFENNLRAVTEGSAPILETEDLDLELLDAFVAQVGLEQQMREAIEADREILDELSTTSSLKGAAPVPQQSIPQIATAGALHLAMVRQDRCEGKFAGAVGEIRLTVERSARGFLGGASRALPGGWGHLLRALLLAGQIPDLACEFLLPSELVTVTADGTILWFPDEWVGGPGAITSIQVLARSGEVDFIGSISDAIAGAVDEETSSEFEELAEDLCGLHETCANNNGTLGPVDYGPIDITSSRWTQARAVNDIVSVVQGDPHTYSPQDRGKGGVELQTNPAFFGDAAPASTTVDVLVEDCVDTGVRPPEISYALSGSTMHVLCNTPRGPITLDGSEPSGQVALGWNDEYACVINLQGGPNRFDAGRVGASEDISTYQGVLIQSEMSCGVTMSYSASSGSFLGEARCWGGPPGYVCQGFSSFSLAP